MDIVNKLELVRFLEHDPFHFASCEFVFIHIHVFTDIVLDFIDSKGHFRNKKVPYSALNTAPLINF